MVKNVSWTGCGYPEINNDRSVLIINMTVFSLQTLFVGLRMLCRLVRIAPWGMDDATIAIAYVRPTPKEARFPFASLANIAPPLFRS